MLCECQKYTSHEFIVIVLHFNCTSSIWAQSLAQIPFLMLENTRKGSRLVASGLFTSYFYNTKIYV